MFKQWTPNECPEAPLFPRGALVTEPPYVSPAPVHREAGGGLLAAAPLSMAAI
jgi:hypothetical protein